MWVGVGNLKPLMWMGFEVTDVGVFWPQTIFALVASSRLIFKSLIVCSKTATNFYIFFSIAPRDLLF